MKKEKTQREHFLGSAGAALLGAIVLVSLFAGDAGTAPRTAPDETRDDGAKIAVAWGDMGARMVSAGVIDYDRFIALHDGADESVAALTGANDGQMTIDGRNARMALNLLWAFGLSNESPVLKDGPMSDPRYGGADGFASTGGWPLAAGEVMRHYGAHRLLTLTDDQWRRVEAVSKGIYRPCCDNATYFPDCNHGMAMLGLLELLAARGASEEEMYESALVANRYWFPDAYATLGTFLAREGASLDSVSPREILGGELSSASGMRNVSARVRPAGGAGVSCAV